MSDQKLLQVQAIEKVNKEHSEKLFEIASNFFVSSPTVGASRALDPSEPETASSDGAVQFYLIGQEPTDSSYSDIMNQNMNNLLAMGGLVHNYMTTNYPEITTESLDINTWINVINHLPALSVGSSTNKSYSNRVKGVSVSGEFLSLIASAIITEGASLLLDFTSYLGSVGDIVFSKNTQAQSYNVATCTYQSYLVDNKMGGYYDYGAIVLRQINFKEYFQEFKFGCASAEYINIDMSYVESISLVQTAAIREGGPNYEQFQNLVNADATKQFENANNFFNAGETPQKDITPAV